MNKGVHSKLKTIHDHLNKKQADRVKTRIKTKPSQQLATLHAALADFLVRLNAVTANLNKANKATQNKKTTNKNGGLKFPSGHHFLLNYLMSNKCSTTTTNRHRNVTSSCISSNVHI